jgi:hypothetical protein
LPLNISLSIETPPDFNAIISVSDIFGIIFFNIVFNFHVRKYFLVALLIFVLLSTILINSVDKLSDRYVHNFDPVKKTILLINEKKYCLNTHYCGECLKKFVLVGDLRNVKHNYDYIDQVNISYAKCKYIFI